MTEEQKADELSSWLGVHVKENQARCLPMLCLNGIYTLGNEGRSQGPATYRRAGAIGAT